MQKETITLYKDFSHPEKELEMSEIVNIIRSDKLKPQVEAIRRAVSRKQKDEVTRLKAELPKVSFSAGYCHSRRPKNLLRHNHLIIIDIDKITPQQLSNLKHLAADDRHLRMGFESPSGNGYKMLYAIEPEADDSSQPDAIVAYHARAFDTVKRYVQLRYNLHPDSSGKDVGRLCYLAYDPHALFCPESIPIKPLTYYSRRSELEKRADARRKAIAEALSPEIVDKEHARTTVMPKATATTTFSAWPVPATAMASTCRKPTITWPSTMPTCRPTNGKWRWKVPTDMWKNTAP